MPAREPEDKDVPARDAARVVRPEAILNRSRGHSVLRISVDVFGIVVIFVALVIPNRLSWITPQSFFTVPLELFMLGLLLLVPGRVGALIRSVAAAVLVTGILFKLADAATFQIFSRPSNPVFDSYLLADGLHFLSTSIGWIGAIAAAAMLCAVLVAFIVLTFFLLGHLQSTLRRSIFTSSAALAVGVLLWTGLTLAGSQRANTFFLDQLALHGRTVVASLADMRSFRAVVNIDAYADVPGDTLFGKLQGKDVLVIFVESYGRTVLQKSDYALHVRPALQRATAGLAAAGFESRSGYLTSPTVGGISWLAHGTALSGLWIDNENRYKSLMLSERPSLVRLFQRAGWHTVGVMPAITMAWPEGEYFGYDNTLTARELDYKGMPFNYVTMPDQFTLSRFQQLERTAEARKPVMAEIALISSHAPWTPIPQVIDWQQVGDGSIFNEQASAGDPPEVVWQDRERVLRQYRESVEYVLATIVSFATTFGDDDLVIMVLGDHQPMPYVTDDTPNKDVLVHLIARDPAVLAAVDHWQWTPGMLPADDAPVWRMDQVRDRFIQAFSSVVPASAGGELAGQGSASISR